MEIALKNLPRVWVSVIVIGLLSACGGANDPTGNASPSAAANNSATNLPSFLPTTQTPPSAQTIAIQMEGGRLNSEELAQTAKTGVLPKPFDGPLLSGAEDLSKSIGNNNSSAAPSFRPQINAQLRAASLTQAYRFYNPRTTAHFFTTNTAERANIIANLAFMNDEGPAFFTSNAIVTGLSPVHRFYNTQTGVHFFTISEGERAKVAADLPQYTYEGIAYYASQLAGAGLTPLYRFYYASKGFHFFTSNIVERDNIIATLPNYKYEGVGYYVMNSDWQAPEVPVPNAQIEASSSYGIAAANALNSLLDWPKAPGFRDMWTARAVADLTGDGLPDAVIASGIFLESNASKPLVILKGTSGPAAMPLVTPSPTLIAGVAPNLNHARKVLLGDFNGDGIKDIFVCAHGYDTPPFPGTTNALLLSGGGKWQIANQPWSSFVGFSHGCASGDARNSSRQDIFVANLQEPGSYWLINDGAGNFTKTQEGIPASIAKRTPVFTAELLDVDGDGFLDLVIAGDESYQDTVVFWGDGTGRFSDAKSTKLPSVAGWPQVLGFAAADFDGDGIRELVVMRTPGTRGNPDFYKGYLIQVLKRTSRTFADISSARSADLNASAPTVIKKFGDVSWIEWTWAADLDGDGKPDLVSSDAYGGAYWAKNDGTKFLPWVKIR